MDLGLARARNALRESILALFGSTLRPRGGHWGGRTTVHLAHVWHRSAVCKLLGTVASGEGTAMSGW